MNGFAKIPRQVVAEGYFAMPELAFKIWVYCLVKANPFPTGTLKAGELLLTYNEILAKLNNGSKTVSRNRVSAALNFLKQNNYLQISISHRKGMKVSVSSIKRYQNNTASGSEAELQQYQNNTTGSSAAELLNQAQPSNDKASESHKNKVKNSKDMVNDIDPLLKQFPRYNSTQCAAIKDYWCAVISTDNPRTVAELIINYMQQWERFSSEVVLAALEIHLNRHQCKGAGYTIGIMKRLQQEQQLVAKGGNQHGRCQGATTTAIDALVSAKQRRTGHLYHLLNG